MAERCGECRFWRGGYKRVVRGECRRHPPQLNPARLDDPNDDNRFRGVWPETDADDWCGEFRPAGLAGGTPVGWSDLSMDLRHPRLNLSARALNVLHSKGAATLGDAAGLALEELSAVKGCGPGTLDEIERRLADAGVRLPYTVPPEAPR